VSQISSQRYSRTTLAVRLEVELDPRGSRAWWLVTFPALVIAFVALAINFVGDGLRAALDPTQRSVR